MQNVSITFLEFAWNSLTEQQQYRINVKYELKKRLENRNGQSKADIYRMIADEFGYSFKRIRDVEFEIKRNK
jgi:hypothetical protein